MFIFQLTRVTDKCISVINSLIKNQISIPEACITITQYPNVMRNVLMDNFKTSSSLFAVNTLINSKFIEIIQKLAAQFSFLSYEKKKEYIDSLRSQLNKHEKLKWIFVQEMNISKKMKEQIFMYTGNRRIARILCNTVENSGHLLRLTKTLEFYFQLLNQSKKSININFLSKNLINSMVKKLENIPCLYFSEEDKIKLKNAPESTISPYRFYTPINGNILLKQWLIELRRLLNNWSNQQLLIPVVLNKNYSLNEVADLQRQCLKYHIYIYLEKHSYTH